MEEDQNESISVENKIEMAYVAAYVIIFILILLKDQISDARFQLVERYIRMPLYLMLFLASLFFIYGLVVSIREVERGKNIILWGLFSLAASGLLLALYFSPNCCAVLFKGL